MGEELRTVAKEITLAAMQKADFGQEKSPESIAKASGEMFKVIYRMVLEAVHARERA